MFFYSEKRPGEQELKKTRRHEKEEKKYLRFLQEKVQRWYKPDQGRSSYQFRMSAVVNNRVEKKDDCEDEDEDEDEDEAKGRKREIIAESI
ncbi:hypothetical protein ANTQUA_LOCUS80 [Anthophora quadrimaculata]